LENKYENEVFSQSDEQGFGMLVNLKNVKPGTAADGKNKCTIYQPKAHQCLSCPKNCRPVAEDEDYNVPQYCKATPY
jgi:hypothetical protein